MTALPRRRVAILKGFVRDRTSVFFTIVFPLMFLVLFGGIFNDQHQPQIDLIEVGDVALVDELPPDASAAFDETFEVDHADDLAARAREVRKGDADVGDREARRHARRALHADRPGEGRDHAGHAARVRRRRQRRRLRAAAALHLRAPSRSRTSR